jgi:hypothetical protein
MKARICSNCKKPFNAELPDCPHCEQEGPEGKAQTEGPSTLEGTSGTRE